MWQHSGEGMHLIPLCPGDLPSGTRSKRMPDKHFPSSKLMLWAWLDLNQRPHPYQRSTAERHANRPFRWSCDSVSPTRMG
jgi:hypothetical protein